MSSFGTRAPEHGTAALEHPITTARPALGAAERRSRRIEAKPVDPRPVGR